MSNEEVAAALGRALSGPVEPLRRFGVTVKLSRWERWRLRWLTTRRFRRSVQRKILDAARAERAREKST